MIRSSAPLSGEVLKIPRFSIICAGLDAPINMLVSGLNRDPRELPKDWPWWFIPDPEAIIDMLFSFLNNSHFIICRVKT